MEDYFAAINNGKLGTIEELKTEFENDGIRVIIEKCEDEYQMVVGNAEDVLRITVEIIKRYSLHGNSALAMKWYWNALQKY